MQAWQQPLKDKLPLVPFLPEYGHNDETSFADFRTVYLAGCLKAQLLVIVNEKIGFFSFSDPTVVPHARILKLLDYDEVRLLIASQ